MQGPRKARGSNLVRTFFTHGSNAVLALALLAWAAAWAVGAIGFSLPAVILGAILFFLSEYGFHRFLFHAPPVQGPAPLARLQRRLHYDHHVTPERLDLLFLPLWFLLPNLVVTGGAAALVSGSVAIALSVVAGAALAILHYEATHYVAHIPYRPRTNAGRRLKKYHLRHHFLNEHLWFGVTSPVADLLLGTYAGPGEAKKSPTVRNLWQR